MALYGGESGAGLTLRGAALRTAQLPGGESAGVDFTQRHLLGMSRHCDDGSEGAGGEREHEDDEKGELIHVVSSEYRPRRLSALA
jgi:hypothetical protein